MHYSAPIPHIVVNDGEAAIKFYEAAFGAVCEAKHRAEDGRRLMHGHLKVGDGTLYLHDDFPEFTGAGAKARTARWVTTIESLPPENRMAGRSNCAAVSRRM